MPPTDYIVVLKADSHARFRRPGESISFNNAAGPSPVVVRFYTRFTDEGHEAAVPRELMAECVGRAESLDDAIRDYGALASATANLTAFVTNAEIGPLRLYVGVDATPGLEARQFVQEFGEFDAGPLTQGRAIPVDEVGAVLGLLGQAPHLEAGWYTAALQYSLALTRWRVGSEFFALGHLYTAAEALEKTIVAQEADRRGSMADLLKDIGARDARQAGAYYRRTVIFGGNTNLLDEVKGVTDGLEHGSMAVLDAQAKSQDLAPEVFKVIRECMLDRLAVPSELRATLLGSKYGSPLDPTLRKTVIGEMLNLPGDLGPPGFSYPFLMWKTGIAKLAFDDAGELQASLSENFTVQTAEGGSFAMKGMRMYGRPADPTKVPINLTDVKITRGPSPSKPEGQK